MGHTNKTIKYLWERNIFFNFVIENNKRYVR